MSGDNFWTIRFPHLLFWKDLMWLYQRRAWLISADGGVEMASNTTTSAWDGTYLKPGKATEPKSQSNSVAVNIFIMTGSHTGYGGKVNLHPCIHFSTMKKGFLCSTPLPPQVTALLRACRGEQSHSYVKGERLVTSNNYRWSSVDHSSWLGPLETRHVQLEAEFKFHSKRRAPLGFIWRLNWVPN